MARREIMQLRQCVFVGTTNDPDYLVDITGNRRFWPIKCGEIDLDKARDLRAQLYAEALSRWRQGEQWWPQPVEERMADEVQRSRLASDPWDKAGAEAVEEAMNHARASDEVECWVTTSEVMTKAGIEMQHRGYGEDVARSTCVGQARRPARNAAKKSRLAEPWISLLPAAKTLSNLITPADTCYEKRQ